MNGYDGWAAKTLLWAYESLLCTRWAKHSAQCRANPKFPRDRPPGGHSARCFAFNSKSICLLFLLSHTESHGGYIVTDPTLSCFLENCTFSVAKPKCSWRHGFFMSFFQMFCYMKYKQTIYDVSYRKCVWWKEKGSSCLLKPDTDFFPSFMVPPYRDPAAKTNGTCCLENLRAP